MKNLFTHNRERVMTALEGGIVVLTAYTSLQRRNDMAFTFEQEANFWWLSGIEAADWWLVIDGTRHKSWLVAPDISGSHEIFDGSLTHHEAQAISGIDTVVSRDEATSLLRDLAKKHSVVYTLAEQPYAEHLDFSLNPAPKKLHEQLERTFNVVRDCRKELASLRAIKQPEEIARMKKAINLTIDAFEQSKKHLEKMQYEYEVEAHFSHYFRSRGASGHAYDPIVAGGKNACTLHYIANGSKLKNRELLLLDIGVSLGGYAADITRTYTRSEATKRQRAVHEAVQTAHGRIVKLLKPNLLVEKYQQDVDEIMIDALLGLGLLTGRNDHDNYRKYFPHAISHGLGVDVHDSLGGPRFLQPGMVLTVEPGIYIPAEGIGVRIEDDILVTATGRINLSAHLSTDL